MTDKSRLDFVRGSLIGGAVGDALGYTVEFDHYQVIIENYGKPGITQYKLTNCVAEISDDTQMTLFTANGMLMGLTRWLYARHWWRTRILCRVCIPRLVRHANEVA